MVMRTTLSKKEFASALGMSDTDVFVLKMFNIVDRDGDGRISFQEFLDTIVLFSKVRYDMDILLASDKPHKTSQCLGIRTGVSGV